VIDEWSRESLAIEVDLSLTGERVKRVLERLGSGRGLPAVIQTDNGPEFTGRVPVGLRARREAAVHRTRKPIQNAFIESFNSRLREECLNEHVFLSLDDARGKIERWRTEYNRERPHSSLGYLTPEEFAAKNQMSSAIARTAWPADQELAGAMQRAPGLGSKTSQFFDRPQVVKGGRPRSLNG
jgi:putative transposase